VRFSIYRYNPETDAAPRMQGYVLEVEPGDKMLLDALLLLKAQDESLSFRRSCREGVCGSDAMNINGRNGLACVTPLASLSEPIELRPLPALPVIRDLVVDLGPFFRQYERVRPFLINDTPPPQGERLQTPAQRAVLDGAYECILCACCTTACPSFWWNPDKYIGPAGLLQAYRFIGDSRDTATASRLDDLRDPFSLFRCRGIMSCVEVCPKGLNPLQAIGRIRDRLMKDGP